MNANNRLAPCPFCGSKAELYENRLINPPWEVRCNGCFGRIIYLSSVEQAITLWNRRVDFSIATPQMQKLAALSKDEFDRWAEEAIQETLKRLKDEELQKEEVIEWEA